MVERVRLRGLAFSLLIASQAIFLSAQENRSSSEAQTRIAAPQIPDACRSNDLVSEDFPRTPTAESYNDLGVEAGRKGNFACAAAAFEAALGLDPAAIPLRYKLALALVQNH